MTTLLSTERCALHLEQIKILLNLLGKKDALISDNTKLEDFEQYETVRSLISDAEPGDYLWELGQRINTGDM